MKNFPPHGCSHKGFTLIEILAVLTILAILIGIAAPNVVKNIQKGRIKATSVQIAGFDQSLTGFNLDCGFFPTTEQGLEALKSAPTVGKQCKNYDPDSYLKKKEIPNDPWNQKYIYISPGKNNPSSYDLFSTGPDGVEGNEDDITNWK